MIDQVARALFDANHHWNKMDSEDGQVDDENKKTRDFKANITYWRYLAADAILSLKNPTPAMMKAAAPAFDEVDGAILMAMVHGYKLTHNEDTIPLKLAYKAMIVEALKIE